MSVKMLASAYALVLPCVVWAAGDTSEPITAFLRTEETSFWRTAKGATVTLPIDFPEGATTASLQVRGTTYSRDYADITSSTFALTLPEPQFANQEDVYELRLIFDDYTMRTARIGLVRGGASGGEATTRCLTDSASARWTKAFPHSVMPIPFGTTSLTVDGETIEEDSLGFTGAQGWYALQNLNVGKSVPIVLTENGVTHELTLNVKGSGLILSVK